MLSDGKDLFKHRIKPCLNPCSNGICSLTVSIFTTPWQMGVLILVLMEYALWRIVANNYINTLTIVLILVLMEYALWRLNHLVYFGWLKVLILVLMEYALWLLLIVILMVFSLVLILVLMEYALWHFVSMIQKTQIAPTTTAKARKQPLDSQRN